MARTLRLLLVDGDAQARAPLAAAVVDDLAAVGGLHAGAKAVGTDATLTVRLIGALHGFLQQFTRFGRVLVVYDPRRCISEEMKCRARVKIYRAEDILRSGGGKVA